MKVVQWSCTPVQDIHLNIKYSFYHCAPAVGMQMTMQWLRQSKEHVSATVSATDGKKKE